METLRKRRVDKFEIVLEHDIDDQYQYIPGEMMRGVVTLNCVEEISINSIAVSLKGEGNVIWETESRNKKKDGKFKTREHYLDLTENLVLQTGNNNQTTHLDAGTHEFPFYFELPESLPSSYIGKFGGVTYIVKAQLKPDRQYGSDAQVTSEPFLVLRRYDLALEPTKLQPYEESRRRKFRGCFGGNIEAFIKLNRTGFVPGEDIRINAEVTNGSFIEVTGIQAALVMHAKFSAQNKSISTDSTVSKHEDKYAMEHGDGRRWNDVRLNIPRYIPESYLEGCDIIDVTYEVIFIAEVNYDVRDRRNLRICVPVSIGTHGLQPDADLMDEPELRPLYVRASNPMDLPIALRQEDDSDDDIEIDHSLFDNSNNKDGNYQPRYSSNLSATGPQNNARALAQGAQAVASRKQDNPKPNVLATLYGDLVSENELVNHDETRASGLGVNESPDTANVEQKGSQRSKKKRKAPTVPAEPESPNDSEPSEEQSRL